MDINTGEKIENLEMSYASLTDDQYENLPERVRNYVFSNVNSVGRALTLGPAAYVNHSCNRNCNYYFDLETDQIFIRASKHIKTGEEIEVYYSGCYFGPQNINCLCNLSEEDKKSGIKKTRKRTHDFRPYYMINVLKD